MRNCAYGPGRRVERSRLGFACLYPPNWMSSSSDDDTDGTCSPSEAREIATRGLLKALSAPAWAVRLFKSSATSTLYWPLESPATLPGGAEDSTWVFSASRIGAERWH